MSILFDVNLEQIFFGNYSRVVERWPDQLTDFELERVLSYCTDIRRGDVVRDVAQGKYRNMGKSVFDGNGLQRLDYSWDSYGAVPQEFTVDEFGDARYWSNTIEHNEYVWVSSMYKEQILDNLMDYDSDFENDAREFDPQEVDSYFVTTDGVYFGVKANPDELRLYLKENREAYLFEYTWDSNVIKLS